MKDLALEPPAEEPAGRWLRTVTYGIILLWVVRVTLAQFARAGGPKYVALFLQSAHGSAGLKRYGRIGRGRHGHFSGTLSNNSASQTSALASEGARQSPRGESEPPEEIFGPFGSAERLN